MDRDLFNRIVDFLVPYMEDSAARKELVRGALHGCSALKKIVWGDDALTFTSRLVTYLDTYGECEGDADPSLIVLLRYVGDQHGVDVADETHDLIQRYTVKPQVWLRMSRSVMTGWFAPWDRVATVMCGW